MSRPRLDAEQKKVSFSLKLDRIGLLHLLHDPCPPSERVYPKLSLFHKFGARSE